MEPLILLHQKFLQSWCNIETVAANPDGININQNCGSTNPDFLRIKCQKEIMIWELLLMEMEIGF